MKLKQITKDDVAALNSFFAYKLLQGVDNNDWLHSIGIGDNRLIVYVYAGKTPPMNLHISRMNDIDVEWVHINLTLAN